jgi:hypothetical protein
MAIQSIMRIFGGAISTSEARSSGHHFSFVASKVCAILHRANSTACYRREPDVSDVVLEKSSLESFIFSD